MDFFLHIDKHLDVITNLYGTWTYAILFLVIFCETGLVALPFLPGDSLLFAAGAIAARGTGGLDPHWLALLLFIAAVMGDTVNYHVGRFMGPKVFQKRKSWIFRPEYLERTQLFFEKHGRMTIIMARFVPIVRTFAPFLSGVGRMNYIQFLLFNVVGGFMWVGLFIYGGLMFGETPLVKKNFTMVIMAIIVVSVMPMVVEYLRHRLRKPNAPSVL